MTGLTLGRVDSPDGSDRIELEIPGNSRYEMVDHPEAVEYGLCGWKLCSSTASTASDGIVAFTSDPVCGTELF